MTRIFRGRPGMCAALPLAATLLLVACASHPANTVLRLANDSALDFAPAWSPDDRQVAYLAASWPQPATLNLANADGSGSVRLTDDSVSSFSWSPDGTRLEYVSFHQDFGGPGSLNVINRDGSARRQLPIPLDVQSADWAPTGERIVFGANGGVFLINADGTGLVWIGSGYSPRWSPDGRSIAYANVDTSLRANVIAIMDSGGGGAHNAVTGFFPFTLLWSPDGTQIAFETRDAAFPYSAQIYVFGVDGSGLRRITDNPADATGPAWAPDGRGIAFASNRDGDWEVYVSAPDGSGLNRLTYNGADDGGWKSGAAYGSGLDWSRDGRIAFISNRASAARDPANGFAAYLNGFDLYVMSAVPAQPAASPLEVTAMRCCRARE